MTQAITFTLLSIHVGRCSCPDNKSDCPLRGSSSANRPFASTLHGNPNVGARQLTQIRPISSKSMHKSVIKGMQETKGDDMV
jgi:hypothetical protein